MSNAFILVVQLATIKEVVNKYNTLVIYTERRSIPKVSKYLPYLTPFSSNNYVSWARERRDLLSPNNRCQYRVIFSRFYLRASMARRIQSILIGLPVSSKCQEGCIIRLAQLRTI